MELFTRDSAGYGVAAGESFLSERVIAELYAVDESQVQIFRIPSLNVVKISFPRPVSKASLQDRDIHSGQHHVPPALLPVPARWRQDGPSRTRSPAEGRHRMQTSIDDLRFFQVVAASERLTAAARHLGLSLPVVSKRLSTLERRLDVRLVQRGTRRLVPTSEGALYADGARRVATVTPRDLQGPSGRPGRSWYEQAQSTVKVAVLSLKAVSPLSAVTRVATYQRPLADSAASAAVTVTL